MNGSQGRQLIYLLLTISGTVLTTGQLAIHPRERWLCLGRVHCPSRSHCGRAIPELGFGDWGHRRRDGHDCGGAQVADAASALACAPRC